MRRQESQSGPRKICVFGQKPGDNKRPFCKSLRPWLSRPSATGRDYSVSRESASQAECREFDLRILLQFYLSGKSVKLICCSFRELVMMRHIKRPEILILFALFSTFNAYSHPYDSVLIFREHKTDDGRIIWTNIPKKCFSEGVLICTKLHPIYEGPGTIEKPEN